MIYQNFQNRVEAGQALAALLLDYADNAESIILALPRGGVPIAYQIALKLHLPLNLFLVRKLGVPGHEELAMGALAEENICVLNQDLIKQLAIPNAKIQEVIQQEELELRRRLQLYRHGKKLPSLYQKIIILVDDGIATGATVKAAIEALQTMQPQQIILAVPVASQSSLFELNPLVTKIVCPLLPEPFYGVGQWYQDFSQTSDEEVISLLEKAGIRYCEHISYTR